MRIEGAATPKCIATTACAVSSHHTQIAWFDGSPQGHSHNDYSRIPPLIAALDAGFHSVEADVFLRDGHLLVGHDEWMLHPSRTLDGMYLNPLRERAQRNAGSVHGDGKAFLLLIDIKRDGEAVYAQLRQTLREHPTTWTRFRNGAIEPGSVTIVLSGNRPIEAVARESDRFVAIDGRLDDLRGDATRSLIPLISAPWRSHFEWDGKEAMPEEERNALIALAATARQQGRMLRFWGAPDRAEAWAVLRDAKVAWINTDHPGEFAQWTTRNDR
jgi:hypothetical protein